LPGILFVLRLRIGCAWNSILEELAPSGSTCWRRLKEWIEAGVWTKLWRAALRHLGKAEAMDLSYAAVDNASVRAVFRGVHTGPNPTDRVKKWCKRHVIVDGKGLPLALNTNFI
jgi:transposase